MLAVRTAQTPRMQRCQCNLHLSALGDKTKEQVGQMSGGTVLRAGQHRRCWKEQSSTLVCECASTTVVNF